MLLLALRAVCLQPTAAAWSLFWRALPPPAATPGGGRPCCSLVARRASWWSSTRAACVHSVRQWPRRWPMRCYELLPRRCDSLPWKRAGPTQSRELLPQRWQRPSLRGMAGRGCCRVCRAPLGANSFACTVSRAPSQRAGRQHGRGRAAAEAASGGGSDLEVCGVCALRVGCSAPSVLRLRVGLHPRRMLLVLAAHVLFVAAVAAWIRLTPVRLTRVNASTMCGRFRDEQARAGAGCVRARLARVC